MNKLFLSAAAAAALMSWGGAHAATDYYLKLDGIKGEVRASATVDAVAATATPPSQPRTAEYAPKTVQRATTTTGTETRAEGIEPDEIDVALESENATSFGVLLGGSGGGSEERARGLERARQVLEENAKASDQAIESVSLNYEKITTRVQHEVQLFGFIPVRTTADVEIDAAERVQVRLPWWTMFAAADAESLGARVRATLADVLASKHDAVMNAIQNAR